MGAETDPCAPCESLEKVMNAMTSSMSKGYEVNGKTYYLSNFGIKTLGYFNAPENQEYAYHIDGDEDDTATSGNADQADGDDHF